MPVNGQDATAESELPRIVMIKQLPSSRMLQQQGMKQKFFRNIAANAEDLTIGSDERVSFWQSEAHSQERYPKSQVLC